jgi:outer membrane immunogenic protein
LGVHASSSMKLIDYATVRARAGYVFGQFLPYAFIGGAVGRMDHSTTVGSSVIGSRDNAINGGVTAGLGVDVAILPNVFLRGEWEYIAFGQVSGVRVSTNTARVGVGVRF